MPPLHPLYKCASPLLISVSIQARGGPPPPPSAVQAHDPIFSALTPQRVETPLQPSDVHPTSLPQLFAFSLQQDVPPLHHLSTCAPPPLISVSTQGRGEPPLLPSTVRAYVPLISDLHLCQGVPFVSSQPILLLFLSFQPCLSNKACLLFSL